MTGPDAPHWWDPADCFGQSCAGMSIPITYEATVLGYAEGMKDVFMQRQYTKGLTNRATGPVRYDPDRAYRTPLGSSQNGVVLRYGTGGGRWLNFAVGLFYLENCYKKANYNTSQFMNHQRFGHNSRNWFVGDDRYYDWTYLADDSNRFCSIPLNLNKACLFENCLRLNGWETLSLSRFSRLAMFGVLPRMLSSTPVAALNGPLYFYAGLYVLGSVVDDLCLAWGSCNCFNLSFLGGDKGFGLDKYLFEDYCVCIAFFAKLGLFAAGCAMAAGYGTWGFLGLFYARNVLDYWRPATGDTVDNCYDLVLGCIMPITHTDGASWQSTNGSDRLTEVFFIGLALGLAGGSAYVASR